MTRSSSRAHVLEPGPTRAGRWAVRGYGPIQACQVCESADLRSVLFLGYLPPVNQMQPIGSMANEESWFPAELRYCRSCHLVQLGYAVDPRVLFPPEYPYTSGSTRLLRDNFAELAREARERLGLAANDLIVDIGSNDGTLLAAFQQMGHRVAGIEPSLTAELAQQRGIPTLMSFFDEAAVTEMQHRHGTPRLVTATNVFAHIHNVHQVMDNVERFIGPDGFFISESHYLADLLETLQYDTIYHEHLRYYSLTSLQYLLGSHGFRVVAVKRIPTHGGSIRVYATKSDRVPVDPSVEQLLHEERERGLASEAWIPEFRQRVGRSKLQLYELFADIMRPGVCLVGIGAPSRASTLITYLGLDDGLLDCVCEIATSKKLNKYMPGTRIPVVDEAALYQRQPAYALLLSWHIGEELCRNLKRRGFHGDFVMPLPSPRIVSNRDVTV